MLAKYGRQKTASYFGSFARTHSVTDGGKPSFQVSGTAGGRQLRKRFRTETTAIEWALAHAKAKVVETRMR